MIERRLADISGPFFDLEKPFRNWSSFPFAQIDTPAPPYVDAAQLARGLGRARAHLRALHAQGYTGIVIDNLAHLVGFERAPEPVYGPDSPARLRARAYRAAFRELFADAAGLGMEVFVTTDMQWSTPELRAAAGPLRPGSARLRELNRWALDELFAELPEVSGLVVRVGEAGGAHNQGGDYAGHMIYTTPQALRGLIADLLPPIERLGRLLIVRTWSVGIGPLGDLVCSPERYRQAFGGLRSPHLLVSVKHVGADFFRHLPDNPTLGLPGPRQIVELQNRREYELFGMVPASTAGLHGAALARAASDPQCAGVWAWNSTGGWGGGRAALGPGGWNLWTELTSALSAAQARAPGLDAGAFVRGWLGRRAGGAKQMGAAGGWAAAAADLYLESAELIERGWYMGPLPNAAPRLGRIVLTPLLWSWWMRPTAALPVWAYLAEAAGDLGAVLDASAAARDRAAAHARRLAALAAPDDPEAAWAATSARYLADALELAHALRALLLPLARSPRVAADPLALARLRAALARHQASWGGRDDFPPLELGEVERLIGRLDRAPRRVAVQLRAAQTLVRRLRRGGPGRAGAIGLGAIGGALALGALARPAGGLGLAGLLAGLLLAPPIRRRAVQAALPWVSRRLDLLPTIFFEAGPALGEWAG